jgi:hypothetical protein
MIDILLAVQIAKPHFRVSFLHSFFGPANLMKSCSSVFNYLMQTVPSKWDVEICFDMYRSKDASLSSSDIKRKVQEDLERLVKNRPQQAEHVALLKSNLK